MFEFLQAIRYHPQNFVKRSVLYALFSTITSLSGQGYQQLCQESEFIELSMWLQDIATTEDGTDKESRQLSMVCLCVLQDMVDEYDPFLQDGSSDVVPEITMKVTPHSQRVGDPILSFLSK